MYPFIIHTLILKLSQKIFLFIGLCLVLAACGGTAPEIADQTFSVAEDAANGTTVGTVQAADPKKDELTFSITDGNTGDVFAINTNTGAITTAGSLDFETAPTYTLTISVSDGKLSTTANITVNVTDVNEPLSAVGNTTRTVPANENFTLEIQGGRGSYEWTVPNLDVHGAGSKINAASSSTNRAVYYLTKPGTYFISGRRGNERVTFNVTVYTPLTAIADPGTIVNIHTGRPFAIGLDPNTGAGNFSWTLNGNPLSGTTGNRIGTSHNQAGTYTYVGTRGNERVTFTVTVVALPLASAGSTTITVDPDEFFTLGLQNGAGDYSWTLNGSPLPGETGNRIRTSHSQAGTYIYVGTRGNERVTFNVTVI